MPTAYLETPYSHVKLHSERLLVLAPRVKDQPDTLLQDLPLAELEHVVLRDDVQITTQALCACLRAGIPVSYWDGHGRTLGQALPPSRAAAATRLLQFQRATDPAVTGQFCRAIVSAKIYNQRRVLQRLRASRAESAAETVSAGEPPTAAAGPATGSSPSPDLVEQAFVRLAALDQDLARAQDTAQIVGFEGASTAAYFQAWASFLPPEFPFERRSARPPLNPVNACISYGASLLYHEMVARLHLTGLDPGLGALHATEDGRWSLALDLMEPFRPALVEAMTLRLFAHRMLQAGDFEPSHGGIYLAASGRRTFLAEYEQRVNREFLSEHVGHRTTLRQQLAGQPVAYKAALTDPPSFRPFRLN